MLPTYNTGYENDSPSGYVAITSKVPAWLRAKIPDSYLRDNPSDYSDRRSGYYILLPDKISFTSGNVYEVPANSTQEYYDTNSYYNYWAEGTLFGTIQEYEDEVEVEKKIYDDDPAKRDETDPEDTDDPETQRENNQRRPKQSNGRVTATTSDSSGGISSINGNTYSSDTYITLTATPDEGYEFVQWSNGATDNPLTIKVADIPANGIWAIYRSLWHNIIVSKSGSGECTVSATVDGVAIADALSPFAVKEDQVVKLTATETSDDYIVRRWSVNGTLTESTSVEFTVGSSDATSIYCIVTVDNPSRFDLNVTKENGNLGTVQVTGDDKIFEENADGEISERLFVGETYEIQAVVTDTVRNRFLGWWENDTQLSTANPFQLINANDTERNIVAKFEVIPYFKCVVEKLANSDTDDLAEVDQCAVALTPEKDASFDGYDRWLETTLYATATNSSRYLLKRWVVEDMDGGANGFENPASGSLTGVSNPLSFNLDFNAKIKAYFGRGIFYAKATVLPASAGGGTATVVSLTEGHDCDHLVNGDQVTFTAVAAEGFIFSRWQNKAGQSISTSATFDVTIADDDCDYYAVFLDSEFGPNAVQKWNASTTNRMLEWRSKVYESSQPFSPVCVRVDAKFYPVMLKIGTFSSPDAATVDGGETRYAELVISNQNPRRLPTLRPERYTVIQIKSRGQVDAIFLGGSMIGMAGS